MKTTLTLALSVLIVFASCKKKKPTPVEEEPVVPVETCKSYDPILSGKYVMMQNDGKDTIEVVFIKNNCPTNFSNIYKINNFAKTVNNYQNPKHPLSTTMDFTVSSAEQGYTPSLKTKGYLFGSELSDGHLDNNGMVVLSPGARWQLNLISDSVSKPMNFMRILNK